MESATRKIKIDTRGFDVISDDNPNVLSLVVNAEYGSAREYPARSSEGFGLREPFGVPGGNKGNLQDQHSLA